MKKIIALLLALMLVLSLSATAFAAEATETISVNAADTHTYEVFQIFIGDLSEDGKLSNVVLGKNGKLPEGVSIDDALAALAALNTSTTTDTTKLAEAIKYLDDSAEKGSMGTVNNSKSLKVEPGYYLLKDVTENLPSDDNYTETRSLYILQVVDDITITGKYKRVTSEKKIYDVNDTAGTTEMREDSADHDIGDRVKFELIGTLPEDYASYKTYYLAFHDTCAPGLTFDQTSIDTMVVKVNGTRITTGFEIVATIGENGAAVNQADGCTFEVVFEDAKAVSAIQAESVVTVEYTAVLNEKAVVGPTGNKNSMHLEFSNDPNYVGDGDPGDDVPPPPPPTDETPEDTVIVFTFEVDVNKVDENEKPLVGASFTLYKKVATPTGVEGTDYIKETTTEGEGDEAVTTISYWQDLGTVSGTNLTKFVWKGVDDGTYRLEETVTPPGYNTMDPIEFVITAEHSESAALPELINLTGSAPFGADKTTGILTAQIENKPGTLLPSTGGMGTTIFYLIGGILVLAAIVMLVTKKRMSVTE